MGRLNLFQIIILRCVPFRLNLFLQTKVWKNGMYFVGMYEEQHSIAAKKFFESIPMSCLLYTSPSPRDRTRSRMPSSA